LTEFKRLHQSHEEFKEKKFEIELSWICEKTDRKHQVVPKDIRVIIKKSFVIFQAKAEEAALEAIEREERGE
jgi:hypothetical protein